MTPLPSGLASISARLDDTPQARGAVAFGRMVRERKEAQAETFTLTIDQMPSCVHSPVRRVSWYHGVPCFEVGETEPLSSAIDRHAALAVSAGYRSADRR